MINWSLKLSAKITLLNSSVSVVVEAIRVAFSLGWRALITKRLLELESLLSLSLLLDDDSFDGVVLATESPVSSLDVLLQPLIIIHPASMPHLIKLPLIIFRSHYSSVGGYSRVLLDELIYLFLGI